MIYDALNAVMSRFIHLTDKERMMVESAFSVKQVPKNFVLVSAGEISKELYFINKGLMRLYYDKEGEYITAYIFREHLFAGCYESFVTQTPGIQYLETLEECELLSITKEALEELYEKVPKVNVLTRKVAEQRFINGQIILSSFLLDSPETRYAKFVKANGDLFLRIPHHIIASYLGITPVSLSRIRKRLIEKGE
ncbi:MAG: Crp/Fnr family transcriptional regulator [Bacteroidia bacterium]